MLDFFDRVRSEFIKGIPVNNIFIQGGWIKTEENFAIENPQTREVIRYGGKATLSQAEQAIESAYNQRKIMEFMSLSKRAEILEKAAEIFHEHEAEMIEVIVSETGKPVTEAYHEVSASIKRLKIAAEETRILKGEYIEGGAISDSDKNQKCLLMRKPLGVILGITPFNYPCATTLFKIAPAIAGGNTLVIKPASANPTVVLYLARIFEEAGLPKGVLNVLTGQGEELGNYLVSHSKVNMISFTGSSKVGNLIAKLSGKVKLHLELGGKCPAIISSRADLDIAVKESVKGALKFSGQRCDALSRFLVCENIYEEFAEKVVEEVKNWKVGDIYKKETQIGPLINEKAFEKVLSLVGDAVNNGAEVVYGGELEEGSLVMHPIVLKGVNTKMRIAWEEIFGPVISIIKIRNFEDAVKIANESKYGLDASVFTDDLTEAMFAADHIESGTVQINGAPAHGIGQFPFGGDKESGLGREGIFYSVYEMTKIHSVVIN